MCVAQHTTSLTHNINALYEISTLNTHLHFCILSSMGLQYTLSAQNIRNIFLIITCIPFCPQNSLSLSGHGLYKVLKVLHRDVGPCWLQCFTQLCQVGWMSFGWWTILDTHGKLLSVKNPAVLQPLTQTGAPGTYYLLVPTDQVNVMIPYWCN